MKTRSRNHPDEALLMSFKREHKHLGAKIAKQELGGEGEKRRNKRESFAEVFWLVKQALNKELIVGLRAKKQRRERERKKKKQIFYLLFLFIYL